MSNPGDDNRQRAIFFTKLNLVILALLALLWVLSNVVFH